MLLGFYGFLPVFGIIFNQMHSLTIKDDEKELKEKFKHPNQEEIVMEHVKWNEIANETEQKFMEFLRRKSSQSVWYRYCARGFSSFFLYVWYIFMFKVFFGDKSHSSLCYYRPKS